MGRAHFIKIVMRNMLFYFLNSRQNIIYDDVRSFVTQFIIFWTEYSLNSAINGIDKL